MINSNIKAAIFIGICIIIYVLVASNGTKPVDWSRSFKTRDKIPFGLYVLDHEVDSLFGDYVDRINVPLSEYFYDGVFKDSFLYDQCMFYVNDHLEMTKREANDLCTFVHNGNAAFLSLIELPIVLADTLKLSTNSAYFMGKNDTMMLTLSDQKYSKNKIVNAKALLGKYFRSLDSCQTTILGYLSNDTITKANFVKVNFGEGFFLIHLEPAVFTNYFLLEKDYYRYTENIASYIPDYQYVTWFTYNQTSSDRAASPLRYIMSQPALKWAWYLLIGGILCFILFNIKRKQRMIVEIPQPTNSTIEFARTIGNLYMLEGDIRNIMHNKILYLLEKIRSDYHLSTEKLDEKFIHSLHARSGKDIKIIERMVFLIHKHFDTDYLCNVNDLERLNKSIENFYK
jgi:hypothetical protein